MDTMPASVLAARHKSFPMTGDAKRDKAREMLEMSFTKDKGVFGICARE